MDFGQAIKELKNGKAVSRQGWNGKDMFVYYVPANSYPANTDIAKDCFGETVDYNPYFAIKNVNGTVSTWVPSVNDCLAEDWAIVNANPSLEELMFRLDTIQTKENLNLVYSDGSNYLYDIVYENGNGYSLINRIQFQQGARLSNNSITGVIDSDLLEVVRERLITFQAGDFPCDYNQKALYHVGMALTALNQRVEDRIARNVLAKDEK